jgi:dienelactone hydrolase
LRAGQLSAVLASLVLAGTAGAAVGPLRLPAPTGSIPVGTRVLMLVDNARVDPFDPRHRHRRLMIQVWYPAASNGPPAAYIAPGVGRVYAREYRLPSTTFTRVLTNAHRDARPLKRPGGYPAILFSPGYGVPHALYTSLLEDLASHGFVVIALDHTYETDAVQFPEGRIVRRSLPRDPGGSFRLLTRIIGQRVADMRFVLRRLPALDRLLAHVIDVHRVGVFGHSLGGLTAANVLEAEPTVRAGADLDGSIFGRAVQRPLDRPFMIMTEHGDGTMLRFWRRLRGPRLFVRIDGTRHLNFSDWNVLGPWLRQTRAPVPVLGAIRARRALRIERAYLDAFFARQLSGAPAPLLDTPSPFREVHLMR